MSNTYQKNEPGLKKARKAWIDQNKGPVGPETSIPEIEELKAQFPFPREDFSFPASAMELFQKLQTFFL